MKLPSLNKLQIKNEMLQLYVKIKDQQKKIFQQGEKEKDSGLASTLLFIFLNYL